MQILEESAVNLRPTSEPFLFPCCYFVILITFTVMLHSYKLVPYFVIRISEEDYVNFIKEEINKVVKIQEELDIDVLVHGEPEVRRFLLSL